MKDTLGIVPEVSRRVLLSKLIGIQKMSKIKMATNPHVVRIYNCHTKIISDS